MPGRKVFRQGVMWLFWPALVVLGLNIENLATEWGLDKLILQIPALAIIQSPWFLICAALIVGAAVALWIDGRMRLRDSTKALEELYAEGVAHRNRLIPPIQNFDEDADRAELVAWGERVLQRFRDARVALSDRSNFRTLNLYQPVFHTIPGKTKRQEHAESMWTEKLTRLKATIEKLD